MDLNPPLPDWIRYLVFGVVACSLLLLFLKSRVSSLKVAILNRWARWLTVSLGGAYLVYELEWAHRPFWTLAALFFLLWLLLETLYTWMAIAALSRSDMSLFPRFEENDSGEEWPANTQAIALRSWLRQKGFRKVQALVSDIGHGALLRASVYQNPEDTARVQVLFVPHGNGLISHSLSFTSQTADGRRIVTDNLYLPYGGFYPESWEVKRLPWRRSENSLLKTHERRVRSLELLPFETSPKEDLNYQQRQLELTNIEEGFLFPPDMQEEQGRITWEGRYRVWKEALLLNYLGLASRSF